IGDAEIVIALGVVEGRFPKRRAEDPILLDVDRAAINQKLGSNKLRLSYEKAEDDQREFYRLMCSAPNITLCYPLTFGESPEVYAAYLDELKGLFPAITIDKKQYENRFPLPTDAR